MSRKERLEMLGDKAKKFTNVYIKNFGDTMTDEKLGAMFEPFGKIISAKVCCPSFVVCWPSLECLNIGTKQSWFCSNKCIFLSFHGACFCTNKCVFLNFSNICASTNISPYI